MAALQSLNLTQESIERYIVSWKLSLTPKRKSLSKSEIIKEVCAGHMTTAEALARLLNLGYSEEDSGLYLADAQQCLVKRRQQAELAEQRKASAAASQIQRLRQGSADTGKAAGLTGSPVGARCEVTEVGTPWTHRRRVLHATAPFLRIQRLRDRPILGRSRLGQGVASGERCYFHPPPTVRRTRRGASYSGSFLTLPVGAIRPVVPASFV
jgi:hypothetical protein